jgi:pseudouridine-5'-phosphate glycosidase
MVAKFAAYDNALAHGITHYFITPYLLNGIVKKKTGPSLLSSYTYLNFILNLSILIRTPNMIGVL